MDLCDKDHEEIVFAGSSCPLCEARKEIERHELCQEKLREENKSLLAIVRLAIESQSWDGNDPNDNRWNHWKDFYSRAQKAINRAESGQSE